MAYIDQKWFERAREIGRVNILLYLAGDKDQRDQQKNDYLSSKEPIVLEYPNLTKINLEQAKAAYLQFKDDLKAESNQYIQLAYQNWIDEQLLFLDMLEAIKKQDDHAFQHISTALFGEPDPDIFSKVLVNIDQFLEVSQAKASVQYISSVLSSCDRAKEPFLTNLSLSDQEPNRSASQIVERLEKALDEYHITNWNIVIDPKSTNLSVHVDQETRRVVVPEKRAMTEAHLEAIVVHEIGVHVRRRENAEAGTFGLLSLGLAGYLRGDEGLSKYEEQKVYEHAFLASIEIYAGISLIRGLAGKAFGFDDVYLFFKHYYLMSRYLVDPSEEHAEKYALNRTVKFFRGTTGTTNGVCLTKDLLYIHGYLGVVDALKRYPKEASRLFVGKYDPGNTGHREILNGLGL